MYDFFNGKMQSAVCGLNLHTKNAYMDIHLATLQVLEKTGVFVEDQQAMEVFGSCGAVVDEKNNIAKLPSRIVKAWSEFFTLGYGVPPSLLNIRQRRPF